MSTKTGIDNDEFDLLAAATDNVVHTTTDRIVVSFFNCHNTSAGSANLTFYTSPDDTSASGKEVGIASLSAGENQDIGPIVGRGLLNGKRIIVVADVVGVICSMTYTQYTGASV